MKCSWWLLNFPQNKAKNITIKLNRPRGMPCCKVLEGTNFWGNFPRRTHPPAPPTGYRAFFSLSRIYCVWWSKKLFLRNPAPICLPLLRHMLTQKIKFTEMRENQENQRSMSSVSQNHSPVYLVVCWVTGWWGRRIGWMQLIFHVFLLISSKHHEKVSTVHVSPLCSYS